MTQITNWGETGTQLDPVEAEQLYDHLVNDHGRAAHEIIGLPLDAVHELEHFDVTMGLLVLRHTHLDDDHAHDAHNGAAVEVALPA